MDKQALEVKEMMLDHSHDVNPKVFMNLPQQRKVNENVSIIALRKKKYIYVCILIFKLFYCIACILVKN